MVDSLTEFDSLESADEGPGLSAELSDLKLKRLKCSYKERGDESADDIVVSSDGGGSEVSPDLVSAS